MKSKIGTGKLLPLSQAGWRTTFSTPTTEVYPEVSTRDGLRSSNAVPHNIPHTTSPQNDHTSRTRATKDTARRTEESRRVGEGPVGRPLSFKTAIYELTGSSIQIDRPSFFFGLGRIRLTMFTMMDCLFAEKPTRTFTMVYSDRSSSRTRTLSEATDDNSHRPFVCRERFSDLYWQ